MIQKTSMGKKHWHDGLYVDCYLLAKQGMSDRQIAMSLGIQRQYIADWRKNNKHFDDALRRARADKDMHYSSNGAQTFMEFLYKELPPHLQELWDELMQCTSFDDVSTLLDHQPIRIRQGMFIHAFVANNFQTSLACRRVGITKQRLVEWRQKDENFAEMMSILHEAKKDFFENHLIRKVHEGDTAAVLFANRTFNKDRYNDKQEVHITQDVNVNVKVQAVPVDELDLDVETLERLLTAVRERHDTIDATPQHNGNGSARN